MDGRRLVHRYLETVSGDDERGNMKGDNVPDELDKLIQPGSKLYIDYGEGNRNNRLIHIRAIVDDEWVVSRTWWKSKREWHYDIDHIMRFEMMQEAGNLKTEKPRP